MMLTQTITLDVLNKIPTETILCRYGETGRKIRFLLTNSETETAISPSAFSVKFQFYKPDGNFIIKDADTVTSEYVEVELDEQTTASAGVGYADLKLTSNGVVIYTCHVSITIDTPVATDETIVSISMIDGYIFPDDFQLKLTAGNGIYFSGEDNRTINATTIPVEEGEGIVIDGNTISVSEEVLSEIDGKQNQLTAGSGIVISGDTISASVEGLKSFIVSGVTNQYGTFAPSTFSDLPSDFVTANMISVQMITPVYCFATIEYGSGEHYCQVFDGNPYTVANAQFEARIWYVPTNNNLTAEEHRVGDEGGNE